jgi:23S rRNA (uracil1939-C5)-methyltransferase
MIRDLPRLREPVEIAVIGAQGDGIAETEHGRLFVPFALPGERVRCEVIARRGDGWTARLTEIETPSPLRKPAPCPHFGICGGCMMQHADREMYRTWKRSLVETALRQRGLEMPAEMPLVDTAPNTRRRARFAASRDDAGLHFGFHAPESTDVVAITECHVLTPSLAAQLGVLRDLAIAALTAGQSAVVTATETETGLDVLITGSRKLERRRALIEAASKAPIARLCWQEGRAEPEPLVQHAAPRITFAGVAVAVPPDAFLQPGVEGEAALVAAAIDIAAKSRSIADLYAGCGTFTFRLAKIGKVAAFEAAKPAVAAVTNAVNHAGLAGRVTATVRNLDSSPLPPEELKRFDCVVFDPPRAGAKTQAEMLARSRVKRVVAVSCNPTTFARDARILVDGGFKLTDLVAVDQFVWSAHVEIVAAFRR